MSSVARRPQIGSKSRVSCFCTAAPACSRLADRDLRVSETSAMWSMSGTSVPFLGLTCTVGCGEAAPRVRMLEQSDIAHYLLSLGVVKPRAVIEEDFAVVDASRRNCVFLATTSSGPTFVVKQAPPAYAAPLAHEAAVLRLLAGAPELARHVPAVVHEDPTAACLVLRTPGGGRDWGDHQGRFPRLPARILGRVLAALHGLDVEAPANGSGPIWGLAAAGAAARSRARAQRRRPGPAWRGSRRATTLCGRLAELRSADARRRAACTATCAGRTALRCRRRARGAGRACCSSTGSWPGAPTRRSTSAACSPSTCASGSARSRSSSRSIRAGSSPVRATRSARCGPPMRRVLVGLPRGVRAAAALRRVVELTAVRLLQTAVERAQGLSAPTAHVVDARPARRQHAAAAGRRRLRPAGAARVSRYREQVAAARAAP